MECLELQGIPGLRIICIILKAAVKNIYVLNLVLKAFMQKTLKMFRLFFYVHDGCTKYKLCWDYGGSYLDQ